jgi:signal transduction histidine kinase
LPGPEARSRDRSAAEPHNVRRLKRLAIGLGICSILAATVVGGWAYNRSRKSLVASVEQDTLKHAQICAQFLADQKADVPDSEALALLTKHFEEQEKLFPNSYLCVVGRDGKLLLHTLDPSKVGTYVGDRVLTIGDATRATIDEILAAASRIDGGDGGGAPGLEGRNGCVGTFDPKEGEPQMLACAYAAKRSALVAIHIPSSSVQHHVTQASLPWAIGLALLVLLGLPAALWGISRTYVAAEDEFRAARASERRSAEQVRILREIDRAILAGGTVEDIVEAALLRLGRLIPYNRASVSLLHEDQGVARVLAVRTTNGTKLGAGSEVRIAEITGGYLGELRAGRNAVAQDLGAQEDLPLFFRRLREEGVRSIGMVPLVCRGELLGSLNLSFDRVGGPSTEDFELGREVADVIALAVLQAQLREALEKQAAELERRVIERTRELSEVNVELEGYVRSVSHDLRAPLRAVHGFGNMLLEETGHKLGKTEREYVERIVSASGRMVALVRDLLDYSRLAREDVRVRPIDLLHVVEEAQDLLQTELDDRHAKIEIESPLLPVVGHHSSLVQTIVNLLSNAAKFVASGVEPRIRVRTEAVGDHVRIWVEDNGIGIPPADQERMFRMFERLNVASQYPGTGIGLAIVRRAVERMGGTMGVESNLGEGSRFWIELPRAKDVA